MTVALGKHPVPAGPLAVRWLAREIPPIRAGVVSLATVELENAGSVAWDSRDGTGICLGYHWLDPLGNPIVWDGLLSALPKVVAPGERVSASMTIGGPIPPGRYRLALDLVDGGRCWFAEVGNARPELDVAVEPRLSERTLGVRIGEGIDELEQLTREALAEQEEPVRDDGEAVAFLAPGCIPDPDWSRRLLDAHEEGYAAVGGSVRIGGSWIARRRFGAELAPWTAAPGRRPGWSSPLVCPSVVRELVPLVRWLEPVAGLPAIAPPTSPAPFVYDGRISMRVVPRALQRAGRPRA
jgi:hypothetical protein